MFFLLCIWFFNFVFLLMNVVIIVFLSCMFCVSCFHFSSVERKCLVLRFMLHIILEIQFTTVILSCIYSSV